MLKYSLGISRANRKLDRKLAAAVQTGSALQVTAAQYGAFRRNKILYWKVKYTSALAATPVFSGHPRWFFAVATDKGTAPATRDFLIFVQEKPGSPWLVAYAPTSGTPRGPLAPGVDVADAPAVVPMDDTRLVMSPARLPSVIAEVIDPSLKSRHASAVENGRLITLGRTSIKDNRRVYAESGWSGKTSSAAARTPVYAVRTKSGGALVWFGIDYRHSYRRSGGGGTGMTWQNSLYGDLHNAFGVPSTLTSRIERLEREEMVAYIPPRGKGKILILGNRWFPLKVDGK